MEKHNILLNDKQNTKNFFNQLNLNACLENRNVNSNFLIEHFIEIYCLKKNWRTLYLWYLYNAILILYLWYWVYKPEKKVCKDLKKKTKF